MTTKKMWNLIKISNIPFSGKLPCNSILRSSLHPEYVHEYGIMSNSNTCSYRFSINQWWLQWRSLETLSNLLPTFDQKTFLNHLGLRIHRMRSPLTRSDRFHIDLLTTSIHTPPYPEYPVHILMLCLGMNQNIDSCAQDSMMVSDLRITCTTPT